MSKTLNEHLKISFEFLENKPTKRVDRICSISALILYGLYRNAVYESYAGKADCAPDILTFKYLYKDMAANHRHRLFHYSVDTAANAVKAWNDPHEQMRCYLAYQHNGQKKEIIGFAHFQRVDPNTVYIAQLGVRERGKSVGRCLMEKVIAHYPEGTTFNVVTRQFNTEAKNLYHKRLRFHQLSETEVEGLGYDARYCGFTSGQSL